MSIERFLVLAVQYKETQESLVDKLVKQMENTIIENHGEIRCSYHGSDGRVVSALEKVLNLTDEP